MSDRTEAPSNEPTPMDSDVKPKDAVFFANDSAELDDEAKASLNDEARWMQDNPKREVVIHGYASDAGTNTYNLTLANLRANALRDYLVQQGVAIERISVVSHGEGGAELPLNLERRAFFATDRN